MLISSVAAVGAWKAKGAATQAKEAAVKATNEIKREHSITDFSSAITVMEEIKRLHRKQAWDILPDRYSELRKFLVRMKTSSPDVSEDDKKAIQIFLTVLTNNEEKIDRFYVGELDNLDIPKMNKTMSDKIDEFNEVLTILIMKSGEK